MAAIVNELVLEQFLALQRKAIRTNLIFSAFVIVIGVGGGLTLWTVGLIHEINSRVMATIGGAILSSLSGFRISEVMQRRERISVIKAFQSQLRDTDLNKLDRFEKRRLEEVLWRIAEKSITG